MTEKKYNIKFDDTPVDVSTEVNFTWSMVITASREAAVKYRQAFEDYTKRHGYTDIRDLLKKSDKLKAAAKNNTLADFLLAYDDSTDNALIEGLSQNQDFFTLLLNDSEKKKEAFGIFADEIYKELREEK